MDKQQKSNDAILMAILQDIIAELTGNNYGNAMSTAAIAMANIERDGFDKNDRNEIAANEIIDTEGDIDSKIRLQFQQHPEIAEDLDKFADENGLMQNESDGLQQLGELIAARLESKGYNLDEIISFAEGGQFEKKNKFVDVKIGNKTYHLLHLTTDKERETGLMDVEDMEDNEGALFDYSKDPQKGISF